MKLQAREKNQNKNNKKLNPKFDINSYSCCENKLNKEFDYSDYRGVVLFKKKFNSVTGSNPGCR